MENFDCVVFSASIDFPSNPKDDGPFHYTAYDYCRTDWEGKLNHSAAGSSSAAKLFYANKKSITFQKLGSCNFWQTANKVIPNVNLLCILYLMALRCFLLHFIKKKPENLSQNSNLDDSSIFSSALHSRTSLKMHIFL